MLYSMTGYGKGEVSEGNQTVIVDVRSLNGKIGDIRIKAPLSLGDKELDLRKLIQDQAVRGKLDVTIDVRGNSLLESGVGDGNVIRGYYRALKEVFRDIPVTDDALFQAVIRIPNVLQASNGAAISDDDWSLVSRAAHIALQNLAKYREAEGKMLAEDLASRIQEILELLSRVDGDEVARQTAFRERLTQKMTELIQEGLDENRLEQEMLYYLDKLDINEEKVRLRQHCLYFLEILQSPDPVKGKKLNFISQEIGREMNTLGAKAQWTAIQHNVVSMKNALEEIKEQLANAL